MNRRLFELFPLLLVFLSGALSAQSIDQQEFREIFDPYLGVWNGEYRIFSQQDELLNSFKVERKYWWEKTIMMEQVTYDFGDMQQTYFNRIVLSEGMPFSFVTDSPNSDKIRSALRGSSLKGTLIWTRVLPKGSLPVRISERIVKKGEERFIDFWGDQEAINNRGASMFVRVEGYLVFLPGSRDYKPPVPEEENEEIAEPEMVPDEPVEPEAPSAEPVVEEPAEDFEPQEEPVFMEEPDSAMPEIQQELTEEIVVETMESQEEGVVPAEEPAVLDTEPQEEEIIPTEEPGPATPEIEEEPVEEEALPEPSVQEPQEESEPVMQPEEQEIQPREQEKPEEPRVEEPEPVVEEELPPPPPMPNPDLHTALKSMNIVGIRDKKGDECIVVDYMLLYRPGDRLDMETRCYFSGLDETHLFFKDEHGLVYEVPRKDKS